MFVYLSKCVFYFRLLFCRFVGFEQFFNISLNFETRPSHWCSRVCVLTHTTYFVSVVLYLIFHCYFCHSLGTISYSICAKFIYANVILTRSECLSIETNDERSIYEEILLIYHLGKQFIQLNKMNLLPKLQTKKQQKQQTKS